MATIIPTIARPTIQPNVTGETPFHTELQIDADQIFYSAGSNIRLFWSNHDWVWSIFNNGVVWNASSAGVSAAITGFYIDEVFNHGTIVGEAANGNGYGLSVLGDGRVFENHGTIAAFGTNGHAYAADFWSVPTVFNTGLIAARATAPIGSNIGSAFGLNLINGGRVHNEAGGRILAEGLEPIAIAISRGSNFVGGPEVINAGLIEANSLHPTINSIGLRLAFFGFQWMKVENYGTIRADVTISAEVLPTTMVDFAAGGIEIRNAATGLLDGKLQLSSGNDLLINAGVITGAVAMGEGEDAFNTLSGVLGGPVDMGWNDDLFSGSTAGDVVKGGRGDDILIGQGGNDLLLGGVGADRVEGNDGNDGLYGEHGADWLITEGADLAFGGEGDDVIDARDRTFALIDGGGGHDRLAFAGDTLRLDLSAAIATGRILSIEEIELAGSQQIAVRAGDATALSGNGSVLTLAGATANMVVLVGGWIEGAQVTQGGSSHRSFTLGGETVLVSAAAGVTIAASAAGFVGLDAITTGAAAPLAGSLAGGELSSPVLHIANYEVRRPLIIDAEEVWQAANIHILQGYSFPQVINHGTISVTSTITDQLIIAIRGEMFESFENNGVVRIVGSGTSSVAAYRLLSRSRVDNSGTFEAIAENGMAEVLTVRANSIEDGPYFKNSGIVRAVSATERAQGVEMISPDWQSDGVAAWNGGTITATGSTDTVAAILYSGRFVNDGLVIARGTSGATNVTALRTYANAHGTSRVDNGGVIDGPIAIQSLGGIDTIYNRGEIRGEVLLGDSDDLIDNNGWIFGAIDLGSGNDRYVGTDARNAVFVRGGDGNDVFTGGAFDDHFEGGAGDDVYHVNSAGNVIVELAGEGFDEVITTVVGYVAPANVERVTFIGNQGLTGTAGSDFGEGTDAAELFRYHQGGDDSVSGGGGDDGFYFGAAFNGADFVDGGAGTDDQIALQGDYSLTFSANNFTNVETIALLSGSVTEFGESGANRFDYSLASVDANIAAGQRLTVSGAGLLADEDFDFNGTAETDGSFILFGGFGRETLNGGQQSDGFYFGDGRFTAGTDQVNGWGGADDQLALRGDYSVTFTANSIANIDTIVLISARDARYGQAGESFIYSLTMHDGNLAGGAMLTISGAGLGATEQLQFDGSPETNGSFRIIAGEAADVINGGAGADLVFGGLGADQMNAWGGADRFVYTDAAQSTAAARDTIHAFTADDIIDLSGIDAVAGGANDAFFFVSGGAFTGTAGQLILVQQGGEWLLQGDTNGDMVADLVIGIHAAPGYTPTVADFVL